MRFLKRLIVLLVVAGAGGAAWWYLNRPEPVAVRVEPVEVGPVEQTVANTRAGTVKACRRARLAPSIGGQIATLKVHEGDRVKAGDLLLELWNQDLKAQVTLTEREAEAAQARARSACLNADNAQREADRQEKLAKRRLASEEAVDRAITAAQAGRADCEAAQATARVHAARLGVTRANLAKTSLTAPFDGVVAEISGELNEYVTPSPPGIPTPPAVDLIDDACYYISAPIDEVDAPNVQVGAGRASPWTPSAIAASPALCAESRPTCWTWRNRPARSRSRWRSRNIPKTPPCWRATAPTWRSSRAPREGRCVFPPPPFGREAACWSWTR